MRATDTGDSGDDVDANNRNRGVGRVGGAVGGVAITAVIAAVFGTFAVALVAGSDGGGGDGIGIVVVGDPSVAAAQDVVVLATGPGGTLSISGTINGKAIGAFGVAEDVVVGADLVVDVVVAGADGGAVAITRVMAAQRRALSTQLRARPPPRGLMAYPEDGALRRSGTSRVVVVDDTGVIDVVTVDSAAGYALKDGRRLHPDRQDVAIALHPEPPVAGAPIVATLVPRGDGVVTTSISVGGAVRALCRSAAVGGEPLRCSTKTADDNDNDDDDGALVVVTATAALVPGLKTQGDVQLVARVGGHRREDLVAVDPRAQGALDRPEVQKALGAQLRVDDGGAAVISPTLQAQQHEIDVAAADARTRARDRFRAASLLLVLLLVVVGRAAGAGVGPHMAGVVVVFVLLAALDGALGVQASSAQASMTTTTTSTTTTTTTTPSAATLGSP